MCIKSNTLLYTCLEESCKKIFEVASLPDHRAMKSAYLSLAYLRTRGAACRDELQHIVVEVTILVVEITMSTIG